jgi:hypothetical protein
MRDTLITNRPVQLWNGLGILFCSGKGDKTRAKISDGYREAKADLDLKYQVCRRT